MPFVRPYVRSDGTPVRGYSRWAPGVSRESTMPAVVALAVVGFGYDNARADRPASPRPGSTGRYPIRFDQLIGNAPKAAWSQPRVSYPSGFSMIGGGR